MPPSTEEQARAMVAQAAMVSQRIRDMLQASLPVAPEQLLTVQVPGTVVDSARDGTYWWNPQEHADTPHRVKVNEARLVDGTIPLSNVMLGPTGKSVARSYAAALDMLIPEDAPIDMDNASQAKSKAAERYTTAMAYLTSLAPNSSKTVVDVYVEKQEAWTVAMKEWDHAKQAAREQAKKDAHGNIKEEQKLFDEWNQANFRNYKNHAQAKYMDWIVNGCKYKVDYYFGIVDVSSAMKRVESSKEAARNLVVIDPDGTTEWQQVNLTPANWADECRQKAESWGATNNKLSRKDYESELKRLRRLEMSYTALKQTLPQSQKSDDGTATTSTTTSTKSETLKKAETDMIDAYKTLYAAQNSKEEQNAKTKAIQEAQADVQAKMETLSKTNLAENKKNVETMATMSSTEKGQWLDGLIKDTQSQIVALEAGLENYTKTNLAVPAIQDVRAEEPKQDKNGKDLAAAMTTQYSTESDRYADPKFNIPRGGSALPPSAGNQKPNKWTKISVSVSTTSQETSKESSSSSTSFSASGSTGLYSASGGFNYSKAASKAAQSTSNCNVDISFDALLVNIERSWLHGELFADAELNTSPDVQLSPGPSKLRDYMEKKDAKTLEQYAYFPSYPTAFIVAANIELEFRGDTTDLEDSMESSHFDANVKVGYGPFSLSASHSQDKSSAKTKMETTATGTRITLEAPAVIGWVHTMLPQLPRKKGGNSLVQPMY